MYVKLFTNIKKLFTNFKKNKFSHIWRRRSLPLGRRLCLGGAPMRALQGRGRAPAQCAVPTAGAPGTGRRPKAVEAATSPSVTVRPTGGCSTSERAVETDPLLPGTDELLAVADVLLVVSPDKAAFILPRELPPHALPSDPQPVSARAPAIPTPRSRFPRPDRTAQKMVAQNQLNNRLLFSNSASKT